MKLADRIESLPALCKTRRESTGLSLREAADEIGVPFNVLARFEKGARVRSDTLIAIARWLHV